MSFLRILMLSLSKHELVEACGIEPESAILRGTRPLRHSQAQIPGSSGACPGMTEECRSSDLAVERGDP